MIQWQKDTKVVHVSDLRFMISSRYSENQHTRIEFVNGRTEELFTFLPNTNPTIKLGRGALLSILFTIIKKDDWSYGVHWKIDGDSNIIESFQTLYRALICRHFLSNLERIMNETEYEECEQVQYVRLVYCLKNLNITY